MDSTQRYNVYLTIFYGGGIAQAVNYARNCGLSLDAACNVVDEIATNGEA